MNEPSYRNEPIGSVRALAHALGRSERKLRWLIDKAPRMYRVASDEVQAVAGGEGKIVYDPAAPLKEAQQRILRAIFGAIEFPTHINGGIRGRSYRDDSALHTRTRVVIKLDISVFFESVSDHLARAVWQHFFNFPPDVARALTALTTHEGRLPRGAPTSAHLANLVFWDVEPDLVRALARRGITYSRYVDDVTLSSRKKLPKDEIEWAIAQVYGMFFRKGLRPNRKKEGISFAGGPLRVHGVNVNSDHPTIPQEIRRDIRQAAHELASELLSVGLDEPQRVHLRHVLGRVAWMNLFHADASTKLRRKLDEAVTEAEAGRDANDRQARDCSEAYGSNRADDL